MMNEIRVPNARLVKIHVKYVNCYSGEFLLVNGGIYMDATQSF